MRVYADSKTAVLEPNGVMKVFASTGLTTVKRPSQRSNHYHAREWNENYHRRERLDDNFEQRRVQNIFEWK